MTYCGSSHYGTTIAGWHNHAGLGVSLRLNRLSCAQNVLSAGASRTALRGWAQGSRGSAVVLHKAGKPV